MRSFSTALNSKMLTASFTTPSPNRIELSVGKFFSFTIVKAATVSVAHKIAARSKHSLVLSLSILF
jgi:hypothetical protein